MFNIANYISWINQSAKDLSFDRNYKRYFSCTEMKQDEKVFYLSNLEKGIEIVLSIDKRVQSIHFFDQDESRFKGILPFGISFGFSQAKIRSIYGKSYRKGGGVRNIYLGYIKEWDKYLLEECSIRFEYNDSKDHIGLITIASLALESYFNSHLQ